MNWILAALLIVTPLPFFDGDFEEDLKPIYEVYKNGWEVDACVEIQHLIRHLAYEHGYPEWVIYGVIITESTFNPKVISSNGQWFGLAQISRYWLRATPVEPYRLTDDYRQRDLLDPEHNLLTLMEIWNYARDLYNIDVWCTTDVIRLLRWHSQGGNHSATHTNYTRLVFQFAGELVPIFSGRELMMV